MKLNKIFLFFGITLPISIAMRFLQLFFTVEIKTGFFTTESGNYGILLSVLIFIIFFATALFGYFTYKKPEQSPKPNVALSISSVMLSLSLLYQLFTQHTNAIPWQLLLLYVSGIATALYFLLFAIAPFLNIKLPSLLTTFPTIYLVTRLICDFTSISKLAIISDNVLIIATYCVMLLFMLNFAKLYNLLDTDKNFKKLLATGLGSVTLCFTNAIPFFAINFKTNFGYQHTSVSENITLIFWGLFIITFLLTHFSKKNLEN